MAFYQKLIRRIYLKLLSWLSPKYERYYPIIIRNKLRNIWQTKPNPIHLFILSPPYCGSTLLNELISSSKSVSVNNAFGTREGQTLPSVKSIMFNIPNRWDPNIEFDWIYIKQEWLKYWDLSKEILLEKSPPNILRAQDIQNAFNNAHFIIFHRNPYAHCESLMRKDGTNPKKAAEFAIQCLKYLIENLNELEKKISFSYEELTEKPEEIQEKLHRFLPSLSPMNFKIELSAKNTVGNDKATIKNLNNLKINKLNNNQLLEINSVFSRNKSVLTFFNYDIISPDIASQRLSPNKSKQLG